MLDLKFWEEKIKEKRKKTDFKNFVKEITSWTVLNLYKNKGKISKYPDIGRIKNIDNRDAQNSSNYFLDYDFNLIFWGNYKKLIDKVGFQSVMDFGNNENSEFVDCAFGVKNSYLSFVIGLGIENAYYSAFCYINSSNIFNSFLIQTNCNNIYFSAGIINSFNVFYCKYINDSANVWFCTNLIGCQECIFCNGFQNQKYCFQNKQYSKEEYEKIKKQILERKDKFMDNYKFISKNEPINYLSENVNGKYNIKSHNVENGYWINNTNNSRNVINTGGDNINNFYDSFDVGEKSSDFYGANGVGNSSKNIYCSTQIDLCSDIFYSYFLRNCSFCLGCIGLKNKSFCILNKQYTKEEWYELVNKILAQMNLDGILGDFFPGELNPFYFNDTMAYLIDDTFTKEEVEKDGYMWRNEEIKVDIPKGSEIIKSSDLDKFQGYDLNGKYFIKPDILKKVIIDSNGNYYKIVKMEYDFLIKYGLPIPDIHWLDRIKLGFKF